MLITTVSKRGRMVISSWAGPSWELGRDPAFAGVLPLPAMESHLPQGGQPAPSSALVASCCERASAGVAALEKGLIWHIQTFTI